MVRPLLALATALWIFAAPISFAQVRTDCEPSAGGCRVERGTTVRQDQRGVVRDDARTSRGRILSPAQRIERRSRDRFQQAPCDNAAVVRGRNTQVVPAC